MSGKQVKWGIVALVMAAILFAPQAEKPKRPVLNAIKNAAGTAIKIAPWVAPLLILDEPQPADEYDTQQLYTSLPPDMCAYGELPEREQVNGQLVISHGAGW